MLSINDFKPLIEWLKLHPDLGVLFTFLVTYLESIAIVGLVFPGSVILAVIGLLIGSGILPITYTVIAGVLGGFLGDYCSFIFGYYYRERIRNMAFFIKHQAWLEIGSRFFYKHGGKSVFLGRFMGPLRPIIPLIAGMLAMSRLRFIVTDLFSALIWAPSYMIPGFLIGAASKTLDPEIASKLLIFLLLFFTCVALFYWFIRKLIKKILYYFNKKFKKIWLALLKHPHKSGFISIIKNKDNPTDHSQLILFCFAIFNTLTLIYLFIDVSIHRDLMPFNIAIWHFMRSLYSPDIQEIMIIITCLAAPLNFLVIWLVLLGYFLIMKNFRLAFFWFLLGFLSFSLNDLLKISMDIPRPTGLTLSPIGGSFPSGHTTMASAFLSFIALLISPKLNKKFSESLFWTILLSIVAVGITRLYLGVHWFTDIIGAYLLGSNISLFLIAFYRSKKTSFPSKLSFFILLLTIFFASFSFELHNNFLKYKHDFQPQWVNQSIAKAQWWGKGLPNFPLYRKNRFGKPIQTMNIEWLGDLTEIENLLLIQGWQNKPGNTLWLWLNIFSNNEHKNPPLLTGVFHDKKPVLEMTKYLPTQKRLLVLRLWLSYYDILDSDEELYIGTISFKSPNDFPLAIKKSTTNSPGPNLSSLDVLRLDLKKLHYKILLYPNIKALGHREDQMWDGKVLLIKN